MSGAGRSDEHAESPDADKELALTAMLAEYESLRVESLGSIGHRIAIMNFTFGALAVLLAALISSSIASSVGALVALVVLPQIAKAALLIWLGEYGRSQRAGRGIAKIEERVNHLVGRAAMRWETSLQSQSTHMSYPYVATVGLVMGSGYAAEVVGVWFLWDAVDGTSYPPVIPVAIAVVAVIVLEIRFLYFFRTLWWKIRAG